MDAEREAGDIAAMRTALSSGAIASAPVRKRKAALLGVTCLLLAALGVRIWHDTHRPAPLLLQAEEAERSQQFDLAKTYLRQAAEQSPSDPEVWRSLAELYDHQHENTEAIAAYEHLVRLRAEDASAWRQLGVLYAKTKRSARGQEALSRAAQLNPADLRTQHDLAANALQLGRLAEARTFYERALSHDPDDPIALAGLAQIQLKLDPSPEGLTRAQQQVARALALHPTAEAHLTYGHIYLLRHRPAEAISELKAALASNAELLPAYGYLAQAYSDAGQPALAQEANHAYQAVFAKSLREGGHLDSQGTTP